MSNIKLFLRANDRIFVNGAVLRTDRKVTLELLNNATFLLENHVLQKEDANTPLEQLYFTVQLLLIDPENAELNRPLIRNQICDILNTAKNQTIASGIKEADIEISSGRTLQGMKIIRKLFPLELKHSKNDETESEISPASSNRAAFTENTFLESVK